MGSSNRDHDRQTSLLTSNQREYVTGEKDVSDDYESKLRDRIGERIIHGFRDMGILAENRNRFDFLHIAMNAGREYDHDTKQYERVDRAGWRENNVSEFMPSVLTFFMALASRFNYGPADWERWLKEAYETVNPDAHATVTFEASRADLDTAADDYYAGESIPAADLAALVTTGKVPINHTPPGFVRVSHYSKPEDVERE